MAHHSNTKHAGWESKPSNQMRLKTYHDGVVYYGIFHSRDSRLQSTIQSTKGMIGLSIGLGDHRLLPVVDHFRGGLLRHLHTSYVGRRKCHQNIALYLRMTLILIDDRLIDDVRDLVSFTSHGVGSGSGAASSKWKQ
jgi:tetrahydromethanopterin S-methyltransferase subunit F